MKILPTRQKNSHKRQNGVVVCVGGSQRYVGAIGLAGISVLRAGADLSIVCAPSKVAWALNSLYPDLVTVKLPGTIIKSIHKKTIEKEITHADVLLIGNGAGQSRETKKFISSLTKKDFAKVIDADALHAIDLRRVKNALLTPHAKELETLLVNANVSKQKINDIKKEKSIKKKTALIQHVMKTMDPSIVILLKGPVDAIITSQKIYYNKTGNPGMTKGGTGDVLAGVCASFIAQGMSLLYAARQSASIVGKAGDVLFKKKKGYTYLASELAEEIKKLSGTKTLR